jgi:hypothetical protein
MEVHVHLTGSPGNEIRKLNMTRTSCPKNRELLTAVVQALDQMARLSAEQKAARLSGDTERATELDKQLDLMFGEKERAVGGWQEHTREHGC